MTADHVKQGSGFSLICHLKTNLGCMSPLLYHGIREEDVLTSLHQRAFLWESFISHELLAPEWSECTWVEFSFVSDSLDVLALKCAVDLVYQHNLEDFTLATGITSLNDSFPSNERLSFYHRDKFSRSDGLYEDQTNGTSGQYSYGGQHPRYQLYQTAVVVRFLNCYGGHLRHRKKKASLDYREEPISTVFASVSLNPNPNECSSNSSSSSSDASSDLLTNSIGREISISCLIRCSRSDYGSIASLNRGFRSLVRSGELYKLRRLNGVIEHWIYFSCDLIEWEAFDPIRRRWMRLPRMTSNEPFMWSDKESLAVGTELLVFGKEVTSCVIYAYSILTNSWTSGMRMNFPRCLFGSASLGEKAIMAGGCDSQGNVLDTAELYNSETKSWETLPKMLKPRKMCSAVFMDEKFYVIGGIGGPESKILSCGEEYDLATREWTEIPNMWPGRKGAAPTAAAAPPLVAVMNNELYAADYADSEVRKYDKKRRVWVTVGRLPESAGSINGWGLAFKASGDQLIVIGGSQALAEGFIELNSWKPSDGPPQWNLLARKQSFNFVYNCAVMGC